MVRVPRRWPILLIWLTAELVPALAASQVPGGQLSYSSTRRLVAYDPVSNFNLATTRLSSLLFEPLVERDPYGSGVLPRLARSWEATPSSVTFFLKRDVRWHDGVLMTAADVKLTVRVIRNPRSGSPLRDEFDFIRSIEILDPFTVRFRFHDQQLEPEKHFLGLYVLPKHRFRVFDKTRVTWREIFLECRFKDVDLYVEPDEGSTVKGKLQPRTEVELLSNRPGWLQVRVVGGGQKGLEGWTQQNWPFLTEDNIDFFLHPIGTGPYRFESVDLNGNVVLDAWKGYHQGRPNIDRIRRRRSSDKNTMINRLVQEVIDLIPETPFEDIARIRNSGICRTVEYPSLKFAGFAFNLKIPFLAHKEVRQALTMALNRAEILKTYYQNQGTVLAGPFSPHSWGYDFELEPYPFAPQKARQLMTPYLAARQGKPPLRLIVSNDRKPEDQNVCHALASTLKKLGIPTEIVTMERTSFDEALRKGRFDLAFVEWNFDHSYNVRPLFHPRGTLNFSGYANPEVRDLFQKLESTQSREKRYDLVRMLQRQLRDDSPYIFLWTTKNIASVHRRIANFKSSNIDPYSFFQRVTQWWISEF